MSGKECFKSFREFQRGIPIEELSNAAPEQTTGHNSRSSSTSIAIGDCGLATSSWILKPLTFGERAQVQTGKPMRKNVSVNNSSLLAHLGHEPAPLVPFSSCRNGSILYPDIEKNSLIRVFSYLRRNIAKSLSSKLCSKHSIP